MSEKESCNFCARFVPIENLKTYLIYSGSLKVFTIQVCSECVDRLVEKHFFEREIEKIKQYLKWD